MAQEQAVLPKGIVLNRKAVYEEIAKHEIIPMESILTASRVFSTTSNKLYDPTARRLENFWSRVLGGDRRYLSGRLISQLFKEISEENSFVKLKGPRNRYEPPSPESVSSKPHCVPPAVSFTPIPKPKNKPPTPSAKVPHPILKKPRGPSNSGPRPTARFVSPPEPEFDIGTSKQDETKSSSITVVKPWDVGASTIKDEKKKGQVQKPKKKTAPFVASTARQRPRMPRRTSSQSSAGASDTVPREGDSTSVSKLPGSQSSVPTILETPEYQPTTVKIEQESTTMTQKAAGKQPIIQSSPEKMVSSFGTTNASQEPSQVPEAKVHGARAIEQSTARSRQAKAGRESIESPRSTPASAAAHRYGTPNRPSPDPFPLMARSSSDAGPSRPTSREVSRSFAPSSSLMSSSLAKVDTSVIGHGTITGFGVSMPTPDTAGRFGEDAVDAAHEAVARNSRAPALAFSGQMAPTEAKNAVSIPLGRSKSQLSILLDRKVEKKSKR